MSNKVNQMVTDQIIKQLESVDPSNYSTPWFCIGHSPVNIRGTAYRGINDILQSHSGFASNIWAAFKQWQEKDCQVQKGQRSQIVGLWKFFDETDESGNGTGKTGGRDGLVGFTAWQEHAPPADRSAPPITLWPPGRIRRRERCRSTVARPSDACRRRPPWP